MNKRLFRDFIFIVIVLNDFISTFIQIMVMRRTKIVATLSDLNSDIAFIQVLFDAGINVARLNTAHLDLESSKKLIENIRAVSDNIAILIDTKGPEIRTCSMRSEERRVG